MDAVFEYIVDGHTLYADALKVRRLLLANTEGRAWTYTRDLALLKDEANTIKQDQGLTPEQLEARLSINRVSVANLEGILAKAAVAAFEFPPFNPEDGSGCTELVALTTLSRYMDFAAGKG